MPRHLVFRFFCPFLSRLRSLHRALHRADARDSAQRMEGFIQDVLKR